MCFCFWIFVGWWWEMFLVLFFFFLFFFFFFSCFFFLVFFFLNVIFGLCFDYVSVTYTFWESLYKTEVVRELWFGIAFVGAVSSYLFVKMIYFRSTFPLKMRWYVRPTFPLKWYVHSCLVPLFIYFKVCWTVFCKVVIDLLMWFLMLNRSIFFTFFWKLLTCKCVFWCWIAVYFFHFSGWLLEMCVSRHGVQLHVCLVVVVMHTKCLHDYVR